MKTYVDRTLCLRGKNPPLFVYFGHAKRGLAMSKQRLSHWRLSHLDHHSVGVWWSRFPCDGEVGWSLYEEYGNLVGSTSRGAPLGHLCGCAVVFAVYMCPVLQIECGFSFIFGGLNIRVLSSECVAFGCCQKGPRAFRCTWFTLDFWKPSGTLYGEGV